MNRIESTKMLFTTLLAVEVMEVRGERAVVSGVQRDLPQRLDHVSLDLRSAVVRTAAEHSLTSNSHLVSTSCVLL